MKALFVNCFLSQRQPNKTMKNSAKDSYVDWLEEAISKEYITFFKYSDFEDIKRIGSGSYGDVFRANWKNSVFALKSFNNNNKQTIEQIINELKIHRIVDHENIIRFRGITNEKETSTIKKYSLVLEYADGGTLQVYLKEHFNELDWNYKFRLAHQLASAVGYMHDHEIIHCDLHAKNILINQGNIKLADFGLSKKISEESTLKIYGVIPYIDPKSFDNSHKLDKKSDVYSVGVLLWQISSGNEPFSGHEHDAILILAIKSDKRENVITGTPYDYSKLYTECWNYEPNIRPDMQEVVSTLKKMISADKRVVAPIDHKDVVSMDNQLKTNSCNCSKNRELYIVTDLISDANTSNRSSSKSSEIKISDQIIISEADLTTNISESICNTIIDKLIEFVIIKHDQGTYLDQIQRIITQHLSAHYATSNLVNWLSSQRESKYVWFLGLFYCYNIGNGSELNWQNSIKAFELFSEAAESYCYIAQVYLAKCYHYGYGTGKNDKTAFIWYNKSANKSIIGSFDLGYCYEFGIGTDVDKEKASEFYEKAAKNGHSIAQNNFGLLCEEIGDVKNAIYWYEKAARNENEVAQYNLGQFYKLGKGVKKNEVRSLELFKRSAENGYKVAQCILGDYYKYGKVVKKDVRKAFEYYKDSADQGYLDAQFQLGLCHEEGIGTEVNDLEAFNLYKKAADRGYLDAQFQLGLCYEKGIGTEVNNSKAFELCEKAANNGHSEAQNNLAFLYEDGKGIKEDILKAIYWFNKAAENGFKVARYNLRALRTSDKKSNRNIRKYLSGIRLYGIIIHDEKHIELFENAANEGNSDAQTGLGHLYEEGELVEKDLEKAIYWYKKAADNKNEYAQQLLDNLLKNL